MPQNQQNPYGFDYDPDWRNRDETEETERGFVDPQVVPPTTRPAEDFAGTYGFEYQPNWREQELTAPDEYGWGFVNAWRRGMERLSAMPDVAQGDYEELAQHFGNLEKYRMSDEDMAKFEELRNTEGFWAKLGGVLANPRLVGQVIAESLPMMAAPIVGATGGGLAGGAMGGPVGAAGGMMAGGGLGSYMTEYYASIGDFFGQQGVNMSNPAELKAAFDNEQLMQQAREHARARGIPIAIFDALSMGLAGRIAKPVSGVVGKVTGGRRIGAGTVGEIGMQAGLGAAGEAGAQLASEGEITDELDVILEGVAEIVPGFAEAGVSRLTRKKAGIPDPNDSPLAALDQAEPSGSTPIPETDIDMRTGKVITRTGDEEYDALDKALEQASVDLEMTLETDRLAKQVAAEGAERAAEIQGSRNMQMIEMEQERDAQLAKQGRLEEARKAAQEDQMWQEQATAGIEDVGAAEGEMVTPRGVPVEGEPIDVAGAQPAEEGMLRPEGVVPPGGRPFGTSLGEKLREAGVRPPEKPQEPPAGPTTPERGPDVTAKEAAASEALMREEEQRALDEEAEAGYPDIPFTDEEIAARRPPDDEGPPGGQPPPPASTAVEKPKPEPEITEAVAEPAKPNVPKPTKRPNYARDNFLTTRAKETTDKRLSMEKFEAEGLDIADMREKVYGGKPAFSRHPNAMGPDDVAEFLNENNYPNPFENGTTGTWDANMALEAIRDEMAGVSDILTGEAIENRATERAYEEDLLEYQRQEEEAAPAGGEQLDMMPEATGRDAQVTRDQQQREREAAAPEADMGVAGDLFTGTSAESRQAAEMEAAQTDIEEAEAEGFTPAEEALTEEEARDQDRADFEARQAQLRDTGETTREPEEIIAEIEANIPTMKGVYGDTFGDMGRPRLVTAFRQLERRIGENEDFDAVFQKVLDKITYKPTRDAFIGAVNASPETNLLVADIERQHNAWADEVGITDWMKLDTDEINRNNARIDELAEMGDPRAIELAKEADHWMNKDRIQAKSSHPRFKQSRKSNKYGGITDIRGRDSISLDAAQLSATVDYDSLTFQSPEDKARADRILEVIDKVAGQVEPTPEPEPQPTPEYDPGIEQELLESPSKGTEKFILGNSEFEVQWQPGITTVWVKEDPAEARRNKFLPSSGRKGWRIAGSGKGYEEGMRIATAARAAASPELVAQPSVDDAGNVQFPIDEEQFNEVLNEWDHIAETPPKSKRQAIDTRLKKEGFIPLEEAQAKVDSWREEAIRQGTVNNDNFDKVVLSLFDATGNWARPYAEAGYDVRLFDIKLGEDIQDFSVGYFADTWNAFDGKDIYAILAACPCTTFSNSGTRWRKTRHDAKDRKIIEEMWGEKAANAVDENGFPLYETPNDYAVELVRQTMRTIEFFRPQVWALENPEGRIESQAELQNWRTAFQPHNFGDPYTKRTLLWGKFNEDLPTANVEPTEGSKMHKMSPSEERAALRSETPEGFAYAFFMANNFQNTPVEENMRFEFSEVAGAIDQAFEAGLTPDEIRAAVEDDYLNYEYEYARESLRAAIERSQGITAPPGERVQKEFKISPSIGSRAGQVAGITQARLDRIAENFAKAGEKLITGNISGRQVIRPDPYHEIDFSEFEDHIRINSVTYSPPGTATSTTPTSYESRKVTHIKSALVALDNALKMAVKYQEETPSALAIARAAAEAKPDEATQAQKEAGNYKKGHLTIAGLDFAIENPAGTVRHGNLKLKDHYGYIKRTEGKDGDQVDVFINQKAEEDWRGDVYVVDQIDPETKKFDEHKVMFGYNSLMDARRGYRRNFNKDWKGTGNVTKMTLDEFKAWLAEPGANNRPAAVSNVTEEGRKARKDWNEDNLYAAGKDMLGTNDIKFIKSVLKGDKRGDIPDTMPLNMAVTELLRIREQSAGFQAPEAPTYMPDSAEIEAAIKPLEDRMPGAPVRLLFDYRQAPEIVQRGMEADGMTDVPAVYNPVTNEIYMFTTRIDSVQEAVEIALHEKVHQGLREAFGAELDTILESVYENAQPKDVEFMMGLSERYNRNMNILEDQLVLAEELIAHRAETDPQNNIVQRVVAFIKKWLRKAGLRIEYKDADIVSLIAEAQNAIARRDNYENVMLTEDVELADTGEIYEVETPAKDAIDAVDKRIDMCKKVKNCL